MNALQGPPYLNHRIGTILTSASGAESLGSEAQPGDQVTGNDLIGTLAGTLERAGIDEPRNLLVEFKFLWRRANGAAATTPSGRLKSKFAINRLPLGLPIGLCPPL